MRADDKRIHAILGDDCLRTMRSAGRYRSYLLKHLSLPIIVTGSEDFPWEERYVIGGWDQEEYEELKKTNPSYTDTFELRALEPPNRYEDIDTKLKRLSDGRIFKIGLSWLRGKDKGSDESILLDDYGVWHTNY